VACDKGEVFIQKKKRRVKVISSMEDQKHILKACQSEPTSGHFGVTKTWKSDSTERGWLVMLGDW